MGRLRVNFVDDPRSAGWLRWALLALGVLLAADVGRSLYETQAALERAEARAWRVAAAPPAPVPEADPEALERQIKAAQEVIERLSLPWNALFAELERARRDGVSLTSVEPEAGTRALALTGEAKDLYTLAGYVETLKASKGLSDVYLARHEQRRNERQRPVAFQVSANWKSLP